jgi:hypothetical protein
MGLEFEAMATKFGSRGVSRAFRVLATFGALALIAGLPTAAHAKKKKELKMDPSVPETAAPTGPVPPEPDAAGHVNYGNPQAEGLGRVTVKSKTGDKVQVYLEGRYFGDAPITIYSVPKGDYIVEGTIVSTGKQVSSPVSVSENEEATVELGSSKIETPALAATGGGGGGMFSGEISPRRLTITKVCLVAAGVGAIGAISFAILENGQENQYEKTAPGDQATLDSIRNTGNRYALLTNLSLAVMGAGLVGAVIAGYPMVTHSGGEKPASGADVTQSPQAFVAPVVTPGGAGAAFSMRF